MPKVIELITIENEIITTYQKLAKIGQPEKV